MCVRAPHHPLNIAPGTNGLQSGSYRCAGLRHLPRWQRCSGAPGLARSARGALAFRRCGWVALIGLSPGSSEARLSAPFDLRGSFLEFVETGGEVINPLQEISRTQAKCLSGRRNDSCRRTDPPILCPDFMDSEHSIACQDVDMALALGSAHDSSRHAADIARCILQRLRAYHRKAMCFEVGVSSGEGWRECAYQRKDPRCLFSPIDFTVSR